MGPREFLARWGRPVPVLLIVNAGQTALIPADPDRYLLALWACDTSFVVRVDEDRSGENPGKSFSPSDLPYTLTHTLHGAMVNIPYTVSAGAARLNLTYVVGRMAPLTRRLKYPGIFYGSTLRRPA